MPRTGEEKEVDSHRRACYNPRKTPQETELAGSRSPPGCSGTCPPPHARPPVPLGAEAAAAPAPPGTATASHRAVELGDGRHDGGAILTPVPSERPPTAGATAPAQPPLRRCPALPRGGDRAAAPASLRGPPGRPSTSGGSGVPHRLALLSLSRACQAVGAPVPRSPAALSNQPLHRRGQHARLPCTLRDISHRIAELLCVEWTSGDDPVQPLCQGRVT